jgi:hypothetical protein
MNINKNDKFAKIIVGVKNSGDICKKRKCDCKKTNPEMSKLNNVASDIPPVVLVEYSLNHLRGQKRAPEDGKRACLESVLQVVDV